MTENKKSFLKARVVETAEKDKLKDNYNVITINTSNTNIAIVPAKPCQPSKYD